MTAPWIAALIALFTWWFSTGVILLAVRRADRDGGHGMFVPQRLAHLKSYFTQGPITIAFPIAITVLTALLAVCAERLWSAQSDARSVGFALLTALAALALIEHWLMVVPLPDAKLWRWMLPAPQHQDPK